MRPFMILAGTLLASPVAAQSFPAFEDKPKTERRYVRKAPAKKAEKAAPEVKPATEVKPNELTETSNLFVALFTINNRLFWSGQVNGKIAFHGSTRSRMEFSADCVGTDKATPCTQWKLRETTPSEAVTGYVSFRVGDRVLIWPHTFILSTTPFVFPEKPIMERL